ncbi:hypothetical protein CYLTODRAFT_267414 [Cylindrobasidium torrendii FP15055 ss-10]|uniref:Uncharacterized protein n=1 Tax=Cylindrobasidium torrendii FP15055 ss-10 TaxID=1314674 RepID=A0A0D7BC37_9AGAR|nr:hypothetical protein CYLTODRAFT_267414 [Cylindrobasidium torrendii FP15055 ss-10]
MRTTSCRARRKSLFGKPPSCPGRGVTPQFDFNSPLGTPFPNKGAGSIAPLSAARRSFSTWRRAHPKSPL